MWSAHAPQPGAEPTETQPSPEALADLVELRGQAWPRPGVRQNPPSRPELAGRGEPGLDLATGDSPLRKSAVPREHVVAARPARLDPGVQRTREEVTARASGRRPTRPTPSPSRAIASPRSAGPRRLDRLQTLDDLEQRLGPFDRFEPLG